jgi:cell division protein FtsW (lipid II flippase)
MGTTVVIVALAFAMYFTAGARPAHLIALMGAGALCMGALAIAVSYRRARLAAFLDPTPPGCRAPNSYQVCQGLLSLGSGGGLGAGLGASVQKAGYLPFPQTDSIYAVLGGELGLLGCALVIGLLVAVVWRGYRAGRRAPDTFGALLACGIATWLAAQAAINIGSVVDAVPFTGVPLPFISYGGAALVSELAAVGVLLNIYAQGAPLRNAGLARRLRRDEDEDAAASPGHSPFRDSAQQSGARGANHSAELEPEQPLKPLTGMRLATPERTWTWSGPSSLARTRGEEQPLL